MVKSVKHIIVRVIIGVLIALILMYLKGGLIADVQAMASSVGTSGSVYASSTDSDKLDVSLGNSWVNWPKGTLQFNGAIYNFNDMYTNNYQFTQIVANVYIVANNISYSCRYTVDNNQRAYFNDGNGVLSQYQTTGFSVTCPNIEPGAQGIQAIHIQGLGMGTTGFGIRIYAPITFTTNDDHSDITNAIDDNTDAQNETNDLLSDDSVDGDNAEDSLDDMNSQIATNGAITQLITLPIVLYQNILSSINAPCRAFNLGTLYDRPLKFTCVDVEDLVGSRIYNIIDLLCCGFFILGFRKKMVDIFNHMTSLNDRGNELE